MQAKSPKKWKMMVLSWICIYPLLNIISFLVLPYLSDVNQLVRTLVSTLILVPLMVLFLSMLQSRFRNWIVK